MRPIIEIELRNASPPGGWRSASIPSFAAALVIKSIGPSAILLGVQRISLRLKGLLRLRNLLEPA